MFREPDQALSLFENIPFLNGGLFACLDTEDDNGKVRYADGFSRNPKKQPVVPNRLFFAESHLVDLSEDFGDAKKKKASVRGLLHILHGYKFTIAESTPVEQEIALDPELLGNVFENLLASYNPETGQSARRQTGSFYTPRPIVDHMVDEALKAHLADALCQRLPYTSQADAQAGLDILFAYTEKEHAFTEAESDALIAAIHACNILDPACGSGAYPMGILHKLVFVLGKLDPHNEKWRQRQISKAEEIEDTEARASAIAAINQDFAHNALDYGRKLYLIENCIYGADIQPIAIQISKLRFFISLICDQNTHGDKSRNLGIRPLPNLETKFVAANSLLGLNLPSNRSLFENPEITRLEKELETVRHRYFSAQTRQAKRSLQKRGKEMKPKQVKPDTPVALIDPPGGYADWLAELKTRIHTAQQRAAQAVNRELVLLYWQIGRDILERQVEQGWGAKVIERLGHDLRTAFPDMKGFSRAHLMYMRAFAQAWPDAEVVQQAVGQLPWGHNLVLLTKLKDAPSRLVWWPNMR